MNVAQSPALADGQSATLVPIAAANIGAASIDQATVVLAQAGDHAAFERIFAQYETAIFNYIYRLMGDRDDAIDMTQDTFLKAYLGLPRTAPDLRLSAWLYRIATNVCLDEIRHRKLVKWTPWDTLLQLVGASPRKHARLFISLDPQDDPERVASAGEQAEDVVKVLALLPTHYRAVLILREYHSLTYNEIAEALDSTRTAIKSLLYRARFEFGKRWAALEQQREHAVEAALA